MSTSVDVSLLQEVSRNEQSGPTIRVEPSRGWIRINLRELWQYREVFYFLVWRDVKLRYKQTALGAAWAVLQPLFTMVLFSIFFGRLAKMPSDGVPYPAFCYTALVPWSLFAYGLSQGSNSLVGSSNLLTKIYFPRLTIPSASALAGLVDFALSFALLEILLSFFGFRPHAAVLLTIPLVGLILLISLGMSFWLSAMNVKYRDIRYVVPFLSQLWMISTPIAYPGSLLKGPWHALYALNPMVGAIEGFRWALLGKNPPSMTTMAISFGAATMVFITGAFYFRRLEKTFADIV
jgi:lipopolysaccharide transport system permease protein